MTAAVKGGSLRGSSDRSLLTFTGTCGELNPVLCFLCFLCFLSTGSTGLQLGTLHPLAMTSNFASCYHFVPMVHHLLAMASNLRSWPPTAFRWPLTQKQRPLTYNFCVCVCVTLRPKEFCFMQGDWNRLAYPVQRSYGISVDEWSDQPLVPASNTLTPMFHPAAVRWFHGFSS